MSNAFAMGGYRQRAGDMVSYARGLVSTVNSPGAVLTENVVGLIQFGAMGYISGRGNNPHWGSIPYEVPVGIAGYALAAASMYFGRAPLVGKIAENAGLIAFGTLGYKLAAGMGAKARSADLAAAPAAPAAAKSSGWPRGSITGRVHGAGALSPQEAIRLAR